MGDVTDQHADTGPLPRGSRVRAAELVDAPGIAAVHITSWEGAYRGMVPDEALDGRTVARQTAVWERLLGDGPGDGSSVLVWVAARVEDDAVLGFAALNLPSRDPDADAGTAEISALYVEPAVWRGGTGSGLMRAALAEAAACGCAQVTLWVLEPNLRARAFYERCGFADDGGRQSEGDGWPVELRMRRAL